MSRAPLALIASVARNRSIGLGSELVWREPEDMRWFKRQTLGCPVIMGRKTWDSLPPRFRPLPGRRNVVVTRQPDWQAEGALCAHSLTEALQQCQDQPDVWVIGGAELYAHALPLAASAHVTEIDAPFEGDAYAPELDVSWVETARLLQTSASGMNFSFVTYQKRLGAA